MKVTFEIDNNKLFDDAIAMECIVDVLDERLSDLMRKGDYDYDDAVAVQKWLSVAQKYQELLTTAFYGSKR